MQGIGVLLALMFAAAVLHAVAMSVMARIAKLPIEEVGIGLGPRLVGVKLGGCVVRINLVPVFSSYAKFKPEELHRLGRFGVAVMSLISPCLICLAIAVVLIGPESTLHVAILAIKTFFVGGVTPWAAGAETWEAIYQAANEQTPAQTAGVMFAVMGTINLLPLPMLPGYHIVMPLFRDPRDLLQKAQAKEEAEPEARGALKDWIEPEGKDEDENLRPLSTIETLLFFPVFLLLLSWLVSLGIAVVRNL